MVFCGVLGNGVSVVCLCGSTSCGRDTAAGGGGGQPGSSCLTTHAFVVCILSVKQFEFACRRMHYDDIAMLCHAAVWLQIPGVPIMYLAKHRYTIERLPEATIGGAPR